MMRLNAFLPLAALLLSSSFVCGQELPAASAPIATEVRSRLSGLVPDPAPAKAAPEGPALFYGSSTLYEYMDGAADVFQAYDVQVLFHREYKAGGVEVSVDIFDMGTPENGFGMYAAERAPTYDFVTIGAEGYRNEGILNFFRDRYYVKLAAFGDGADAVLQQFATAISGKIRGGTSFPAALSKLPDAHRKPRTEKYLRMDPLGHSFLAPAYQAVYELDGVDRPLMVSMGTSADDAAARLKALEAHFRRTGQWTPAPELGTGAGQGSNTFEGSLMAATAGHYVLILLKPSPASVAFLKEAIARLR